MGLLGTLTPARFLEEHWQKKPLLVRQAIPGFAGLVSKRDLARLAGREDVHARTVRESGKKGGPRFFLDEGPFAGLDLARAPKERFTLLVGGLEAHVEGAWELLARFSFVPWARVDDLMVSWAAPGGSVGPHYDLYDVFLLQGPGRRRWQIDEGGDLSVDEREEVRVLRKFRATSEWVLEPGDMLYLPPRVGHWGVAVDECLTYSIGFSAPTHEQLLHNFLGFLGEGRAPEGMYEDPDLTPQEHPGELGAAMVQRVARVLEELRWTEEDVGVFMGRLLTGPKPHTPRSRPKRPLSQDAFERELSRGGALIVARSSRLLFYQERVFVDGEVLSPPGSALTALRALADERRLALPLALDAAAASTLYALYRRGALCFAQAAQSAKGRG